MTAHLVDAEYLRCLDGKAFIDPDLSKFGRKVRSQFDEDGVIERLAECLGIEHGTFVEIGVGPAWQQTIAEGLEGNFVYLREKGWSGVLIDATAYPRELDVVQSFVTPLNINKLLDSLGVSDRPDFMSIDVDGQEFWIWMALMRRPKVLVLEYNGQRPKDASETIQFDPDFAWDATDYYGASLLALDKLAKSKRYTLVWTNGVNAIFVADELVANKENFSYDRLFRASGCFGRDPRGRPWVSV